MKENTEQKFVEQLTMFGISLTEEQLRQFRMFYENLIKWNKVMNLTTITEESDVYSKHFLDSLSIVRILCYEVSILRQAHLLIGSCPNVLVGRIVLAINIYRLQAGCLVVISNITSSSSRELELHVVLLTQCSWNPNEVWTTGVYHLIVVLLECQLIVLDRVEVNYLESFR